MWGKAAQRVLPWLVTIGMMYPEVAELFEATYKKVKDWFDSGDQVSQQRASLVTDAATAQKITAMILSHERGLAFSVGLARAGCMRATTIGRVAATHTVMEATPIWVTPDEVKKAIPDEVVADFKVTYASEEFYNRFRETIAAYMKLREKYGSPGNRVSL